MTLPAAPPRMRTVEVGGTTLPLRRPDRSELDEIFDAMDEKSDGTLRGLMDKSDELIALSIRACVRESNTPEPQLSKREALEWAYESMMADDVGVISASSLARTCLRLCGLGNVITGKAP